MLGTYRLLLALLVALSHANVRINVLNSSLNPGVIAVIGFYLISGYVMTGLIQRHYGSWREIGHFYADRAMRLLPQYYLLLAITLVWFFVAKQQTDFLQHPPQISDWVANLTVVPLNYFMFNQTGQFTAIPPAWSLGAEIQFYLLMPILLLMRLRWLAMLIASVVFGLAAWGYLNTDYFGYRLLPGVLLFFLLGSYAFEVKDAFAERCKFLFAVLAVVFITAVVLQHFNHLDLPYNKETLLGLSIGLPLLVFLGAMNQRHWDNRLGDLSYGVFLNHFLIQWGVLGVPSTAPKLAVYIALSIGISYLTQRLVEQPVLKWRKNLRIK